MTKVTNTGKYDGILQVAGVEVRKGATVEVDADEYKSWKEGHAAKIWLKEGFIKEGGAGKAEKPAEGGDQTQTDEEKAAAAEAERQALLTEARELGLNPNANTGTDKLKEQIAAKKG